MTRLGRRGFYERVPALFERGNLLAWEKYEETLYAMARPVTWGNFYRVRQFTGGNAPTIAMRDPRPHHDLDRILSRAKYPRAGQIGRLEEFSGNSTEVASALLHFNNPAFPIYDSFSLRGLNQMGFEVPLVRTLTDEAPPAYQTYIDTIQQIKEAIPFQFVPERNYYLTRVIQLALWELGREVGPNGDRTSRKESAAAPA